MRKNLVPVGLGIVALFLQTAVFPHVFATFTKPDLVLILAVYLGLFHEPIMGGILVFFLGCLMDVFAGSTLGFFALTKTLVFLLSYGFRSHLYFGSHIAKAGLVSLAGFI